MNIYRKLTNVLSSNVKEDLFFKKDLADNGLSFYASAFDRNRQKMFLDRFFLESHRIAKAISIVFNLFDRKMARLQAKLLRLQAYRNPTLLVNKKFHNKHKGQRCFVVANGPSLANQDLSFLANEITIATNTIFKHPQLDQWQPTYYCTAHVERFYDNQRLNDGFVSASLKDILDYFKSVHEKLPNSEYFIPLFGLEANQQYNFLPSDKTYYTAFLPYPTFEFLPTWPDLVLGLPGPQDSSQYAIAIAMAMGFSEIILLGCDHDWFIHLGEERHFFKEPIFKDNTERYDSTKQPLIENLFFAYILWKAHRNLKEMADARGVKIINATGGGVLDVYPLGCYEEIVAKKTEAKI